MKKVQSTSILIGVLTTVSLYAPAASAEALPTELEKSHDFDSSYQLAEDFTEFSTLYEESSSYSEEKYSEQFEKHQSESYSHEKEAQADCHCDKEQKISAAKVEVTSAPTQPTPPTQPAPPAPVPGRVLGAAQVASGPVAAGQTSVSSSPTPQLLAAGTILILASAALFILSAYRRRLFH